MSSPAVTWDIQQVLWTLRASKDDIEGVGRAGLHQLLSGSFYHPNSELESPQKREYHCRRVPFKFYGVYLEPSMEDSGTPRRSGPCPLELHVGDR